MKRDFSQKISLGMAARLPLELLELPSYSEKDSRAIWQLAKSFPGQELSTLRHAQSSYFLELHDNRRRRARTSNPRSRITCKTRLRSTGQPFLPLQPPPIAMFQFLFTRHHDRFIVGSVGSTAARAASGSTDSTG
jgi:hypothetical protein